MQEADIQLVIGTPCAGCGQTLTRENLAAMTTRGQQVGPVGVCTTCVPRGQRPPEGMATA